MAKFRVVWEIDVEADTPREAARLAKLYHPDVRVQLYTVHKNHGVREGQYERYRIDLSASARTDKREFPPRRGAALANTDNANMATAFQRNERCMPAIRHNQCGRPN